MRCKKFAYSSVGNQSTRVGKPLLNEPRNLLPRASIPGTLLDEEDLWSPVEPSLLPSRTSWWHRPAADVQGPLNQPQPDVVSAVEALPRPLETNGIQWECCLLPVRCTIPIGKFRVAMSPRSTSIWRLLSYWWLENAPCARSCAPICAREANPFRALHRSPLPKGFNEVLWRKIYP